MLDGMNQTPDYSNPNTVFGGEQSVTPQASAILVWITGAACVGLFGLCSVATLLIAILEPAEVMSQLPAEQIEAMRIGFWVMPICMSVLFVLPGLVLVVLGFGVRAGKRGAIVSAISILWTQAALLGLILTLNLAATLLTGDLVGLLFNLVIFGAMLALIVATALRLHATRPGGSRANPDEPWNSHLV